MKKRALSALAMAVVAATGCRVQVDKTKNGEDKTVKIETPVGGLHVRTNEITAADVGLPVYPGAEAVSDSENNSADVQMGFGKWQLRVKAVPYQTPDAQDKVLAYYRRALGRFGDVIECKGDSPVGTPIATRDGLTCRGHGQEGIHHSESGLTLRAGSKNHQHIVDLEERGGKTRFTLVELELPENEEGTAQSQ
jgi:hypothetical protein